jgi:hypothetical protein
MKIAGRQETLQPGFSTGGLLFQKLPNLYNPFIDHPDKVNSAGQIDDTDSAPWFRDFLPDQFLSLKVCYTDKAIIQDYCVFDCYLN